MSDSWNVPSRKSNCSISMLIEKMNAVFPLCHSIFFQPLPIFSWKVHSTTAENGSIIIAFSMHSVVSRLSPFTISQMPQPLMTSDNGFNPNFRFNNVRNEISEVTILVSVFPLAFTVVNHFTTLSLPAMGLFYSTYEERKSHDE